MNDILLKVQTYLDKVNKESIDIENKEVIDLYNSAKAKAPNGSDKIDAEIVDDIDDQLPEKVLSS